MVPTSSTIHQPMCRVDKQIRTGFSHFASGCHFLLFPLRSPLHSALKTNAHKNKSNSAFPIQKQTPYLTRIFSGISLAVPAGLNWIHRLLHYPLSFLNNLSAISNLTEKPIINQQKVNQRKQAVENAI